MKSAGARWRRCFTDWSKDSMGCGARAGAGPYGSIDTSEVEVAGGVSIFFRGGTALPHRSAATGGSSFRPTPSPAAAGSPLLTARRAPVVEEPRRDDVLGPPRRSSDRGQASPRRGQASPRRGQASPRRGLASTRRGLASPRRGLASPCRGLASPRRGQASLRRGLASPRRVLASPRRALASPRRALASPSRGLASPSRGLASPSRGLASPSRGLASSRRALRFPIDLAPPRRQVRWNPAGVHRGSRLRRHIPRGRRETPRWDPMRGVGPARSRARRQPQPLLLAGLRIPSVPVPGGARSASAPLLRPESEAAQDRPCAAPASSPSPSSPRPSPCR